MLPNEKLRCHGGTSRTEWTNLRAPGHATEHGETLKMYNVGCDQNGLVIT